MPLRISESSGKSDAAAGKMLKEHKGFVSGFLPKTGRRDERDVGVTEVELGDTVRGSVQTDIGTGHYPVGVGGFSQYLSTFEYTGGSLPLGMGLRVTSHDSTNPINPGIRVNTTTTRTMGDGQI